MKINDRYEIRVVVLEIRDGIGVHKSIGDIYDNFEEFKKDKPYSSYKFGYVVFDTEYGYVPDECMIGMTVQKKQCLTMKITVVKGDNKYDND